MKRNLLLLAASVSLALAFILSCSSSETPVLPALAGGYPKDTYCVYGENNTIDCMPIKAVSADLETYLKMSCEKDGGYFFTSLPPSCAGGGGSSNSGGGGSSNSGGGGSSNSGGGGYPKNTYCVYGGNTTVDCTPIPAGSADLETYLKMSCENGGGAFLTSLPSSCAGGGGSSNSGGGSSSNSGGGGTPKPTLFCDFGYPSTAGGGCFPIDNAANCDLDWGVVTTRCGQRYDLFCDWGIENVDGGGCYILESGKDCSYSTNGGNQTYECPIARAKEIYYCYYGDESGTCDRIGGYFYDTANECALDGGAIVRRDFCEENGIYIYNN